MVTWTREQPGKDVERSVWGYALEVESIRYTDGLDIRERENKF